MRNSISAPGLSSAATLATVLNHCKEAFHQNTSTLHRFSTTARDAPPDRSHRATTSNRRGVDMFRQHHRHVGPALALALALGLCAAPLASADPQPLAKAEAAIAATQHQGSPAVRSNPDEQVQWSRAESPAIVRVVAADGGFHWPEAGVGAGGVLVIVGLALAATRAATNGRRRHPGEEAAVVSH
jgi:hypothetical protein